MAATPIYVKKVVSGTATTIVDNFGLPTLHEALQLALSRSSSVLITTGAICSAVHITDGLYMFFDSHSHGKDTLSSEGGRSILISFSSLEDLVVYLYAFYESMLIELNSQFGILPVEVFLIQQKQQNSREISIYWEYERENSELLNLYFEDQHCRQLHKSELRKHPRKAEQCPEDTEVKRKKCCAYFQSYRKKMGSKKEF